MDSSKEAFGLFLVSNRGLAHVYAEQSEQIDAEINIILSTMDGLPKANFEERDKFIKESRRRTTIFGHTWMAMPFF